MAAFKPNFIAPRCQQFLKLISQTTERDLPSRLLLRTLGLCVSVCPPPSEQRVQVVNMVWHAIGNIGSPDDYIGCIEAWMQFVVVHFTVRQRKEVSERRFFVLFGFFLIAESGG